jgi:FdhD protein
LKGSIQSISVFSTSIPRKISKKLKICSPEVIRTSIKNIDSLKMTRGKKTRIQKIVKIKGSTAQSFEDEVVEESPLSIFLNDEKIITLMSTPSDQKLLALGFLFSEGLIREKEDVKKILFSSRKNEVRIFTQKKLRIPKTSSRIGALTSGCGKGKSFQDLEDIDPLTDVLINLEFTVTPDQIERLVREFEKRSSLFRSTGGTHSAALADKEKILLFNEDIGRHNAVDKVLGESLLKKTALQDKILISSGRVSSDILLKAWRAKISLIVSRSAPTSLAVELAQKTGLTIVGFARGKRMNVYSYPMRVVTG